MWAGRGFASKHPTVVSGQLDTGWWTKNEVGGARTTWAKRGAVVGWVRGEGSGRLAVGGITVTPYIAVVD